VTVDVTVALPVRDGGPRLEAVLRAVRDQDTARNVELLVCDSGSVDGSAEVARSYGARVLRIAPSEFSHGATRNLLVRSAGGAHVAFLTQDAVPATRRWLDALLGGFDVAPDVALAFGPYVPRPGATPMTVHELESFFASIGDGRVDRLDVAQRALSPRALLGARGFFSDANGAILRAAWERVPFRDVPYAEDQQLAVDMLRAGYAKVYVAEAGVEHSHEYSAVQRVQRCFDEWRALREVYGFVEPLTLTTVRDRVLAPAKSDVLWARARGDSVAATVVPRVALAARATLHHAARAAGAALGSRHDRLPPAVRRRLSLESRTTFPPIAPATFSLDPPAAFAPDAPAAFPPDAPGAFPPDTRATFPRADRENDERA
jgi:rhamnosyltransferase